MYSKSPLLTPGLRHGVASTFLSPYRRMVYGVLLLTKYLKYTHI